MPLLTQVVREPMQTEIRPPQSHAASRDLGKPLAAVACIGAGMVNNEGCHSFPKKKTTSELFDSFRARFISRFEKRSPDECWPWIGKPTHDGRGFISYNRYKWNAPQAQWFLTYGQIPKLFVCHTCDNPGCVNPKHLFLGSPMDNMRDASRKGRLKNQTKTHCLRGHPLTIENLDPHSLSQGKRSCIICRRIIRQRYELTRRKAGVN